MHCKNIFEIMLLEAKSNYVYIILYKNGCYEYKKNIYLGRYRKSTVSEQRGQTMIVD